MTIAQAAERLGISERHAYDLVNEDPSFPAYRIGRRWAVSVAGLREWDAKQREQAA